jgi:glycerophosphoryl diester phosphodiesterase
MHGIWLENAERAASGCNASCSRRSRERDRENALPTSLIRRAHKRGLKVHTWTFRNEPFRLAADYDGDPKAEYKLFFALGIDGLFSDFTDTAVAAREEFFAG